MGKHTAVARIVLRYAVLTAIAFALVALFFKVLRVNQTTVALAFLVLVLITASRWRLAYSLYLSLLCGLLYNFFFLPPIGRFTIADPQDWVALLTFLCASVLVSHLSDRERREAETSEERRRDVELLYDLSQKLLLLDEPRELAQHTPAIVASVCGFSGVALYVSSSNSLFYSGPEKTRLSMAGLKLIPVQGESAVLTNEQFTFIQLRLGLQHVLGRLAVTGREFTPSMYEAIGSLVSVALERAAALERTSRLEAARENERLRSTLVDSITHDLRTPLTAMRAAATTLLNERQMAEADRIDLITVVDEECARLDRLIGQAVEMARVDSDSLRLDLKPQEVRELIELTAEQMQRTLRDHPVDIQVPQAMPPVPMDRTLMRRVLQHLLENAAAYSVPGQPISVSARIEEGRLLISVADRGPGIDPDELPFIFDKYFRGKGKKAAGTGMGLAIAKAILRAHHGGISVESRLGEGSEFTFWIPLELSAESEL